MPLLRSTRSESASRASAVRNAIAITKMEGGEPSAFCQNLLALYVSGEISGAEMRESMIRKARGIGPGWGFCW
jgi:Antitoxin VbhA